MNSVVMGCGTVTINGVEFQVVEIERVERRHNEATISFANSSCTGPFSVNMQRDFVEKLVGDWDARLLANCMPSAPAINERTNNKVAQWKRERSPTRYR
jgi:hypothetical protein